MTGRISEMSERTQILIAYYRGMPGEFYLLKGLLIANHPFEIGSEHHKKIRSTFDTIQIAQRMDEIRAEDLLRGKHG